MRGNERNENETARRQDPIPIKYKEEKEKKEEQACCLGVDPEWARAWVMPSRRRCENSH
jgi:hypothetical protein